jgi:hypothetical protein
MPVAASLFKLVTGTFVTAKIVTVGDATANKHDHTTLRCATSVLLQLSPKTWRNSEESFGTYRATEQRASILLHNSNQLRALSSSAAATASLVANACSLTTVLTRQ